MISADVRDLTGLVHLQLGELARLSEVAIGSADEALLRRTFSFVERLAKRRFEVHPEILNALFVSYLERLEVDSPDREWALELLPPLLHDMRQQVLAASLAQLSSKERT